MKFGGTSVADAERLRSAARLVAESRERCPVVVVSAVAGVTDGLVCAVARAADGVSAAPLLADLAGRHESIVTELVADADVRASLAEEIGRVFSSLGELCSAIAALGEATPRARDAVVSRGEYLSSRLLVAALAAQDCPAEWVDPAHVILTDAEHGGAHPDAGEIRTRARAHVAPVVDAGRVPVMGGFVGATRHGITTTLGRGGSDFTAALLGAALEAEEVQVWTDVDGMMTADPRVVAGARVLPSIPHDEAAELAYFGAKVLHPATIRPAVEAGIPVCVRNSLRPEAPGTRVTAVSGEPGRLRAVAAKKGISVLTLSSPRMLMAHGVLARIFEVFERHRTSVDLVATSEVSVSLTVDDADRLESICEELSTSFTVQREDGLAIVSLVGRGILGTEGIAARLFSAVRHVNVRMISVGASDINASFVVAGGDADRAVTAVHDEFFSEERGRGTP